MRYQHCRGRRSFYFEGWYFKQQSKEGTIAFIPSYHAEGGGTNRACLQVITTSRSYAISYPANEFYAADDKFLVRVGGNVFSEQGAVLDLEEEELRLSGKLEYGRFTPLRSPIMGPFRFVPFLQCRHGVISLGHAVRGSIRINDRVLNLDGGMGYVETDRGRSFPSSYLWTQCSWLEGTPCCVMLSIADIPFGFTHFTGCLCSVLYQGEEYRLATYQGVKILKWGPESAWIRQGPWELRVTLLEAAPLPLYAPQKGVMSRVIHESASGSVRYEFYRENKLVFDHIGIQAGFEYAVSPEKKA